METIPKILPHEYKRHYYSIKFAPPPISHVTLIYCVELTDKPFFGLFPYFFPPLTDTSCRTIRILFLRPISTLPSPAHSCHKRRAVRFLGEGHVFFVFKGGYLTKMYKISTLWPIYYSSCVTNEDHFGGGRGQNIN